MNPEALELIPLSTIAAELASSPTVDALARVLDDDVVLDAIGRRCVSAELATLLLDDERRRRDAAVERSRRQAETLAARAPKRARVKPAPLPEGGIAQLMAEDAEREFGPRGLDRSWDAGGSFGPPRRPRRTAGAK